MEEAKEKRNTCSIRGHELHPLELFFARRRRPGAEEDDRDAQEHTHAREHLDTGGLCGKKQPRFLVFIEL